MAAAAYYAWGRAGRPLDPSRPIEEIVTRLKLSFPLGAAAHIFGWGADESHYLANPPQDHTPYSATGWPLVSPKWWVFATDVMHRPDLGVDCNVLFPYWLAEAKAGRTPWVKYLIWQAKLYDVRNGWAPQKNSGHFDHIHISVRTDWKDKGLGAWSLTPPTGDDDMANPQILVRQLPAAGGDGSIWLADGSTRYRMRDDAQITAVRQVHNQNGTGPLGPLSNGGNIFDTTDIGAWGAAIGESPGLDGDGPTAAEIATATADLLHGRLAG